MFNKLLLTSAFALALAVPAMAQDSATQAGAGAVGGDSALAVFTNVEGTEIGSVTLTPNEDGLHFHQTGKCDASTSFKSAGSHFNPTDMQHGLENADGPHAGDLPNVTAAEDGTVMVNLDTDRISLTPGGEGYVFDDDGTALVIHAGRDDQQTDPSGDSGDRVACAVIEPGAAVE